MQFTTYTCVNRYPYPPLNQNISMIPAKTIRGGIYMLLLLPMCLFISYFRVAAQPAGYAYGKAVTIHSSQVSGTQTNFPVLINVTDPNLRTTANGGRVRSASGN